MKNKKFFLIVLIVAIFSVAGIFVWNKWASSTKIALVNFPSYQASNIALSNTDKFVKYVDVPLEEMDKLTDYDFVLVWAMGIKINDEERAKMMEISKKVPVHFFNVTSPENKISSLKEADLKKVSEYLENGNKQNYQSLGQYIREKIDGKKLFVVSPKDAIASKKDIFFHIDENVDFKDVNSYEKYLKQKGIYKENAPKIALFTGIHSPFSGDKKYIDDVISHFEEKGFNVYPIASMEKRLEFLEMVSPDAVLYFPHGRVSMFNGDAIVEYLKRKNIPLFTPLSILQLEETWLKDKMGMFGGFMGQTIVMPELDGAVYPYVVIAQEKNKDGIYRFKTLPSRLDNLTQIVKNFVDLKNKPIAEKKVAIYYFKGMGKNALTAQGLEAGASLYNFLKQMKEEGYKVDNLPSTLKEFEALLDKSGSIIPAKAQGIFQKFIEEGNPMLVESSQYDEWLKQGLTKAAYQSVKDKYGEIDGGYMSVEKDGKNYLAVAQISFGNVVILPQPAVAMGKDDFTMAHGVKEPPTHAYLGSYLWVRNGFKADALVHFGTHGSLEFTEGKQVALSSDDWADALVGTTPHFYYYTIANIGESVMAKRRSYATTVSYLTPPFVETDMRHTFTKLQDYIHEYFKAPENQKKEASILVKKVAVSMGLHRDLRLDSTLMKPYTEEEIQRLDNFAEEISTEKINSTLYRTGEAYQMEHINSTVMAMSADPIAYSLASLDKQRGKVDDQMLKNARFFNQKYLDPSKKLVAEILAGKPISPSLIASVAGVSVEEIEKSKEMLSPKMPPIFSMGGGKGKMPKGMMGKPDMAGKPNMGAKPDMGAKPNMAGKPDMGAKPQKPEMNKPSSKPSFVPEKPKYTKEQKQRAMAIVEIDKTIRNIQNYREALIHSPQMEYKSMFNALQGGYVAPSLGGDPIANPRSLPTGHNLYSINAEMTPSEMAWERGKALANNTISTYLKKHGKYPKKIAYTFWSSEFIETEGVSIAQALYMLGVEPIRDSFGRITDVRLIPSSELKRPRIDIVIQTSGQFRDLAASRLFLLTKAIELASNAEDKDFENQVNKGSKDIEKALVAKGISPKEARELSQQRIFGGIGGGYSTGTKELMLEGNKWEKQEDIANVYINNMGAVYGLEKDWGEHRAALFEASLQNTDVLIQPRQNNTWGALSLDHVFEFMGGMNTAIKKVTGKDPDAYLADYRNHNRMRMQELKEALGVESRATIFNPKYIKDVMKGSKGSAGGITELVTNAFGWEATRPEVIDDEFWNELHDTYILDKGNLGINEFFERENPAAMQEITAVMLESARKGLWKASDEQVKTLSEKHIDWVQRFGIEPSGFAGTNDKLQQYIQKSLPKEKAQVYQEQIQEMQTGSKTTSTKDAQVLKKEEVSPQKEKISLNGLWIGIGVVLSFIIIAILIRKKQR